MHKCAVFLVLLLVVGCQPAQEISPPDAGPRPVKVAEVKAIGAGNEYNYSAEVLPAQTAELSFKVGGQIVELPVHAMDEIKKGDMVARLDARNYTSNVDQIKSQIAAESSRLRAMTAGSRQEDIASLRAAVSAAQAQLTAARSKAELTLTQYRKGTVAKEQLDADLASVKTARAQLTSNRQALSKGRTGSRREDVAAQESAIESLQTQLRNARATEGDATLRAPFDGVVAERKFDNFTNIQPNQVVVVVQNLSRLELSFSIPGPDVAHLGSRPREKLKVEAMLDAVPERRFPAEVVEFNTRADQQTRTFRGRVAIERPEDFNILPGMVGKVVITDTSEANTKLGIPGSAVTADTEGNPMVWVLNDESKVEMRPVKVGELRGGVVEVSVGVNAGETVVTAGLSAMMPGLEVRPVDKIGN